METRRAKSSWGDAHAYPANPFNHCDSRLWEELPNFPLMGINALRIILGTIPTNHLYRITHLFKGFAAYILEQ